MTVKGKQISRYERTELVFAIKDSDGFVRPKIKNKYVVGI